MEDNNKRKNAELIVESKAISFTEEEEISLIDVFFILAKHKFLIFWITFLFCISAVIISLLMTPQYKAQVRILNPKQGASVMAFIPEEMRQLANIALPGIKEGNTYVGILESRTVEDYVLDRFAPENWREMVGLGKEWTREELVKEYIGEKQITETEDGLIEISVVFEDPTKAAAIANAYVDALKEVERHLSITEISQRRLYYEKELEKARQNLLKSEAEFKEFQEKTGVYSGQIQLTANTQSRINLRAKITAKEIQLKSMLLYATNKNPEVVKLKEEISLLQRELAELESKPESGDPLNPQGGMPAATIEYLQKYRDWRFNETIYETLLKLYESARMQEAADPVIIQVLDEAYPPDKRFKPKRKLMVIVAIILGFFVAVMVAFIKEFILSASQDEAQREKIKVIKEAMNPKTYINYLLNLFRRRSRERT
ncbi:GNVR domain-containing protein [Thermovirga sp.]|uniref:GumC family protein n=1 Tax=Thermovirga sp. TaxID=2699834 RepID=UPI0025E5076B|nr:GNVR domain-containing protein [Thermovirga sp.]MBO8154702.1 hypothetical protein [Thermovirga sp.]